MGSTPHGGADLQVQPFRRHLAGLMRPELPGLADEIIAEIRATIPEYARPLDGAYGRALRGNVDQALASFVDMVADPDAPRDHLAEVCRRLGRLEARQGRSLDSLQAAYLLGTRVAWRRVMGLGERAGLPSPVMSQLADAAFDYLDDLASESRSGYLDERAASAEGRRESRRRLLVLLLELPPPSPPAVAELAEHAAWEVPGEVTMVAVQPGPALAVPAPEGGLLADLACAEPHLLVPGPLTASWQAEVMPLLCGRPAAAGLTVPAAAAADSLRWARQALTLAQRGVIDGNFIRCEDHLITLWLLADEALAGQVARRELAGLADLTPRRRCQLIDTLAAVLETRGTAAQVAERLGVHPQTVRYRIRKLEQILGSGLTDPVNRFATELAVRAQRLRERASRHLDGRSVPSPRAAGTRPSAPDPAGMLRAHIGRANGHQRSPAP
jgi:hypothetical protein